MRGYDTLGVPTWYLARSSSRLGHGPLKAGARVRVPYALPGGQGVQEVRGVTGVQGGIQLLIDGREKRRRAHGAGN